MLNNAKQVKDAEELWRYRLSMDRQLTIPAERVVQFMAKYRDFYERRRVFRAAFDEQSRKEWDSKNARP